VGDPGAVIGHHHGIDDDRSIKAFAGDTKALVDWKRQATGYLI
jgi:hypothetical protein